MDGETEKSRIGVRVTAASISKVGQTGASKLDTSTSLSCTIRVTASNGWYHDFSGVIIGAVPAYDEGYKKGKAAISLVMDPIDGSSVSLGFGASKTITAKLVDGSTPLKTASVTVKAPAKPTIVLGITPGSKTLNYGEAQTVTATVKENGTEIKRGTVTITAPPAVTLDSLTFGSPTWVDNTHTSISATATASNGETITDSAQIDVTAHYNAGYNKANSLYTAVSIYKASTAHKIVGLSGTNIGTAVAVTNLTLWSKPNDPSSAKTYHTIAYSSGVYRKGSAYTHYVANGISSNTTLYERESATYYTKSAT